MYESRLTSWSSHKPACGLLHWAWISSWRRMLGERKPRAAEAAEETVGRIRTSWEQASLHFLSRMEFMGFRLIPNRKRATPASQSTLFPTDLVTSHGYSLKRKNWESNPFAAPLKLPVRFPKTVCNGRTTGTALIATTPDKRAGKGRQARMTQNRYAAPPPPWRGSIVHTVSLL